MTRITARRQYSPGELSPLLVVRDRGGAVWPRERLGRDPREGRCGGDRGIPGAPPVRKTCYPDRVQHPVSALARLAQAGFAGIAGVFEQPESETRSDSWQNVAMGFGTTRDKTSGTSFSGPCIPLLDQECADLFQFDDIAGKIVSALPREAFREAFGLAGLKPEKVKKASAYLERFQLAQQGKSDAVWGRCFGGCGTWLHVDDGAKQDEPLVLENIRSVHKLVTVDKRFLQPFRWYTDGPKVGEPEVYSISVLSNGNVIQIVGFVHETRLVIWPGDMTEQRAKVQRNGWDYSVLQKPYDALKSSGNTWKAIEILTSDANQAVFKIKNLWRMIAMDPAQGQDSQTLSGPSGGLLQRIRFMDLVRSVSKAIVLDADGEEFERKPTAFGGLADLSDRAWNRVAAAADMPVTILTGQSPAGLQATGASDLRWWYGKVASEQTQTYEPRIKRLLQVLLSAQDSGVQLTPEELRALTVKWCPLWAPTAAELADMQVKFAQTAQILIQEQMSTPEEQMLSAPEGWFSGVDRDRLAARLQILNESDGEEQATQTLQLTPTDIAAVVTVNQALASVGLPNMSGPEGEMTVEAYRAKAVADAAPKPAPGARPPGGGFGA